ncbi:maleylpyruvate isomerase family mycothiol-dependent enzyme [Lentzea sp. BCCO 10_0856]|uniref:Maleylpyruvate isomerase family mycothiol-dependent enzyme n=1 Tax=Lentzea miocenica TaxID=3095431 RepID=A0ABU4T9E4_9PSEU|nr:maleylpyruvate isomerase family mycothiol-dependent enzyme [Lentzea sp. BCCO 10_0856]MDX8034783.1 maleylpyruvate isomerase family mycothiol-dependent enzyme [Lentzea sp. BCCO 10_0856]
MHNAPQFPDLLRLIDDRSTAFRAAVAAAPSLDAKVPACPEWTLADLAWHIGERRQIWAATVAAGSADTRATPKVEPMPQEREAVLAWLEDSTKQLLDALAEAGPDSECWVGWTDSQSAPTTGAVARHQVQEIAVHTYDAQLTIGEPRPLPEEVALDGVEEFLLTCNATTSPWPHEPAVLGYTATEGRSWALRLSEKGARAERLSGPFEADLVAVGTASDIVLTMYGRVDLDVLKFEGDVVVLERLVDWVPA